MKKLNLLSKAEMKKVIGGTEDIGGSCLYCATTNYGQSCWYRKDTSPDAMGECQEIYPNEDPQAMGAGYSPCLPGCTMN